MSELKMKSKTFHTVSYSDLEDFIQEHFNHPDYSFPADQECSNDSSHTFYVGSGEIWEFDEYDQKDVREFMNGRNPSFITGRLMQHMFEQRLIPEGEYLVEVSW